MPSGFCNFALFFSIVLYKTSSIFAFCASLSPSNLFPVLLIHSAFLLFSPRSHILLKKCFVFLSYGCWYIFVHSSLFVGRIFVVVLECPVLSVSFYPVLISFSSSFFCLYLLVYFLELYLLFYFLCCFFLFVPIFPSVFPLSYYFYLLS